MSSGRSEADATIAHPNFELAAERFEAAMNAPGPTQELVLRNVLSTHGETEYGRRYGFATIDDLATFRKRVPLVKYDDLEQLVAKMVAGEPDVLVAGQPLFYAQTTGTSATPKRIPFSIGLPAEHVSAMGPMIIGIERDHPGTTSHCLTILGKFHEGQTEGGIVMGSAAGFARRTWRRHLRFLDLIPEDVWEMVDYEARYYAILRLALQTPLRAISTFNPSTILTLFSKVTHYADRLADDLERGTLVNGPSAAMALDGGPVTAILQPKPELARRLRESIKANGRFDPMAVWPDLSLLHTWKAGMSAFYLRELAQSCPKCVIRSAQTAATEGSMFAALHDDWVGGVPELTATVLEFLPEDGSPGDDTINGHELRELKEGQGYRVIMTNQRGMYRYLTDDVFFIEGWHRDLPIMRFSHRHGLTSSLTGEKLTESHVLDALDVALRASGVEAAETQLAPEWGTPPHYVLLLQPRMPHDMRALASLLVAFENALSALNPEYQYKRETARLAPPDLMIVPAEAFQHIRRQLAQGRSDATVKISRLRRTLLKREDMPIEFVVTWTIAQQAMAR